MVHIATALFSAGSNARGQLAQGTQEDSHCFRRCVFFENQDNQLLYPGKVLSVAAGANHTVVLSQPSAGSTQLWGCGDGRRGQLGHRYQVEVGTSSVLRRIDFPEFTEYKITSIAASWEASFVALSHPDHGDVLLSTGNDDFGVLGIGSSPKRTESGFNQVAFENSLSLEYQGLIRILELRTGPHNAICILSCEEIPGGPTKVLTVGWGASRHGQLGISRRPSQIHQAHISIPTIVPIQGTRACAVGSQHIVFMSSSCSVMGLGSNRKDQISNLEKASDVLAVGATWNGSYIVRQDPHSSRKWTVLATGSNSHGQLASSPDVQTSASGLRTIVFPEDAFRSEFHSLACGSEHVLFCTRKTNKPGLHVGAEVWGWGWNEHGNLGLGHTDDVLAPALIWPQNLSVENSRVSSIWAGCGTSWIAVEMDNI